MTEKNNPYRQPSVYPAADGARGLACLFVLLTHAVTMFYPKTAPYLAGTGKIGVWLFFVLSAFLLTTKMLKDGFNRNSILSYALGRFLRIFPLFIISVIVYRTYGTAGLNTWTDIGDAILLERGFAHLWTVPVELKFYLCLPFIAYGLLSANRIGGIRLTLLSFAVLLFLHQTIWPYSSTPINSIDIAYYLPTFAVGVFLAFLPLDRFKSSSAFEIIGVGGTVFAIVISTPGARHYIFGTALDFRLSSWFIYFGFLWAFFLALILNGKGLFGRCFAHPLMRRIGAWSYPIYLFHWLIYVKLIASWPENFPVMLMGIIGTICTGAVVHYFVESPIESFRKKFQDRVIGYSSQSERKLTKRFN